MNLLRLKKILTSSQVVSSSRNLIMFCIYSYTHIGIKYEGIDKNTIYINIDNFQKDTFIFLDQHKTFQGQSNNVVK